MSLQLGIAAEDAGAAGIVCGLADEVLCGRVQWLERETLEHVRKWRGLSEREAFLRWQSAFDRARDRGLRVHGFFGGSPGGPDAWTARAVLLLFSDPHSPKPAPAAIVLARDLDGKPERLTGIRQAISDGTWSFEVLVAAAQPEAEAWIVTGFRPRTTDESRALQGLREELGFDPVEHPERLTSTVTEDPRDAKRVEDLLTANDAERRRECVAFVAATPCARRAGANEFVEEVESRLVPLLSGLPTGRPGR